MYANSPGNRVHCYAELALSSLAVAKVIASTHCAYPRRDGQAELAWVAGYISMWFAHPKTVTGPSTNRGRRKVTSLVETNALPLYHVHTDHAAYDCFSLVNTQTFCENVYHWKICTQNVQLC